MCLLLCCITLLYCFPVLHSSVKELDGICCVTLQPCWYADRRLMLDMY